MKVEEIARVCHEVNRAYCESVGDKSQQPWLVAPTRQRESAVAGVKWRLANRAAQTSAQHEAWLAQKKADGWKYGPEKDIRTKVHPCFVPYDKLPKEQQVKDHLFVAVVLALETA